PKTGGVSFKKADDGGYVFEMKQDLEGPMKAGMGRLGGMGGGMGGRGGEGRKPSPEQQEQAKQMMRMMLQGSEAKITVVMPGAVKSADGMKALEGRKAQWRMGEDDILGMMDKAGSGGAPKTREMKGVGGEAPGLETEWGACRRGR